MRVAANILNRQSLTAESRWSSFFWAPPPPPRKEAIRYKTFHAASELDRFSGTTLAPENECSDEPSGYIATELISYFVVTLLQYFVLNIVYINHPPQCMLRLVPISSFLT